MTFFFKRSKEEILRDLGKDERLASLIAKGDDAFAALLDASRESKGMWADARRLHGEERELRSKLAACSPDEQPALLEQWRAKYRESERIDLRLEEDDASGRHAADEGDRQARNAALDYLSSEYLHEVEREGMDRS